MTLDDFLKQPGAPSAVEFANSLGFHEGQVRQWRHGYGAAGGGKPRVPSPENCVVIEKATGGQVTRQDLRPDDWHLIWPELPGVGRRAEDKAALLPAATDKPTPERAVAAAEPQATQRMLMLGDLRGCQEGGLNRGRRADDESASQRDIDPIVLGPTARPTAPDKPSRGGKERG